MKRIGYFVPEFPGQTHIFFWREMKKLRELGIEPEVVSTRRPAKKIVSHSWATEAMEQTEYLFPPQPTTLLAAMWTVLISGPLVWLRLIKAIGSATGVSLSQRLRLVAFVLLGAQLVRLARRRKWQHVHVHSCADAAHVALFARLIGGLDYSMTLHGPISDYGPNQPQKWQHSRFAVIITEKLHREATEQLHGSLPNATRIAPMGVDTDNFVRTSPYIPYQGNGPFRVFACGRLNPCKGHDDLIKAIGQLRAAGIDAQLKIAGAADVAGDEYLDYLQQVIREQQLAEHVELLGAVSEQRVREELEEAHVFALASLHEPLGVVFMEAMGMKLPIVTTNGGGVAELVHEGVHGYLVDPQAVAQLADALEQVAIQPTLATSMGERGYQRVVEQFHSGKSAEVIAAHIFDDFQSEATAPWQAVQAADCDRVANC